MTENKRFTVDENHQGVYAYIKDNNEYIGKRCGKNNVYYVCDLLNEQDQKIKELEKANKDYDDAINEISDILMEAYEYGVSNPYLKRIGKVKVENR